MVSDVKGTGSTNPPVATGHQQTSARPAPERSGEAVQRDEKVTVTELATRLQRLTEAVSDLPTVDQKRVAELREAIESGTYAVDERDIAERLTAFEQMLGRNG